MNQGVRTVRGNSTLVVMQLIWTVLLSALAVGLETPSPTSGAVRVVVVADRPEAFAAFLERFPLTVERWQWTDLETKPFEGIEAIYLLSGSEGETACRPVLVLSREVTFKLYAFVQKGGGFYVEGSTPTISPTLELFGFVRDPGLTSVGILKVIKARGTAGMNGNWITDGFPDEQLWQVRATSYFRGKTVSPRDQVLLEMAPAVGTYSIYRIGAGEKFPVLIASNPARGRGLYATLPLTEYLENGYGPRAAWERLLERIALAPLRPEIRDRMLRETLRLHAWTEPRVWAPAGASPARAQLVVECPKEAQLRVEGLPEKRLEWKSDSEGIRRAWFELAPGEYRLHVEAAFEGRKASTEVPLVVSNRQEWYRRAVDRNLRWFLSSGMLPAADGSKGVLEGFRSLDYGLNGSLRTDCVTQAAITFALYSRLSGDSSWEVRAKNALNFIFRQGFQDQDKARPTFGFWKFFDSLQDHPVAIYADDNSWAAYSLLRIYQLTRNPEYLRRALATLDGLVDTQTPSGLRIASMEGPDLLEHGRRWYAENGKPDTDPHYVSNADRTMLLAYEVTQDPKYLGSARRSIDAMARAFPNFRRSELTRATQFAVFLSSPALLYHYTQEEKYRALLLQVLKSLREHQDGTGAIAEWGNSTPANFGGEGPAIIFDGEPISDQLYTTSFVLLNLHDACYLLREAEACDSFVRLADYLTRIQIQSPDPRLHGAWNRAFDFKSWETYGNNSDPFWGPDSIESGWTNTIISIALMDYLGQQSAFRPARP